MSVGGADGTVRLWDVASGEQVLALLPPRARPMDAVFSPDGWRLAVCCEDGAGEVWDARPVPRPVAAAGAG